MTKTTFTNNAPQNKGVLKMKIATNYEINNKPGMLIRKIAEGENVYTWSVQDDMYSDDIYNGTFNQAKTTAKALYAAGKDITGIALIKLDKDLSADICYRAMRIEELFDSEKEYKRATTAHNKNA